VRLFLPILVTWLGLSSFPFFRPESLPPDFNPIELWWSQLKSFLRQFSPTTTKMVDILLATARLFGQS
ncbi:hypothetical protein QUB33_28440, partial [Microcoleus sp. B3-A4]